MPRVTERVEPLNADRRRKRHHRLERLGCVASSPRILCQDIARRGPMRCFKREPAAADEPAIGARQDQVRTARPPFPLRRREREKRLRVGHCRVRRKPTNRVTSGSPA